MKAKALIVVIAVGILGALGVAQADKKTGPSTSIRATNGTAPATGQTTNRPRSYRDGNFTGNSEDTPYGPVQVEAIISAGKITDINFLQMPFEAGHSREVTSFAEPQLKQMAINRQSAQIDFVSGATDTSISFERSLQAALDHAAA